MYGELGHLFIIIAFVTILVSVSGYFMAIRSTGSNKRLPWIKFARGYFFLHSLFAVSALACLFLIIYFHKYEYHYAWKHSSGSLPLHFLISSMWEGQEGSFLLWAFWNVLVGLVLIKTNRTTEPQTMVVFGAIQLFLLTMVLGAHIFGIKIGSSPFMLLRDVMPLEIFTIDPGFVPRDGSGLNPLLQNFWMAVHPPVIFLGFALSGVPFSLSIASLWTNKTDSYIKASTPWILVTAGVLSTGIMMGAYWAYETLNFGGYWNWDPVENAILVPWIVFIAALHGNVLYRRKGKGLPLTLALSMAGFLLVVYSTFLTRSGILGNASVHSFTDLGLSGQLFVFLLFFTILASSFFIYRYAAKRKTEENTTFLSLEFWMLLGISVLCLSAFQVILPTSIPVFNVLLEIIGIDKQLAPPADAPGFYSKFQVWFASAFCVISGSGQIFFWKRIQNRHHLERFIIFPATITLIVASLIIYVGKTSSVAYICLITSAIYLMVVSIQIATVLIRNMERVSIGGTFAHTGMALMMLGFVYSAGHQKMISKNLTINSPDSGLPVHSIRENLLLSRNIPKKNNDYSVTYLGKKYESLSRALLPTEKVLTLGNNREVIMTHPVKTNTGWLDPGDTVRINSENVYYTIEVTDKAGEKFIISPRMQNNPEMGYIASPDIKSFFTRDIYTHVTNFPDPEKIEWSTPVKKTITPGEQFEVSGLLIQLDEVRINETPVGIPYAEEDIPLEASVTVRDGHHSYTARPIFHIDKNRSVRLFPDRVDALGVKIFLSRINPDLDEYELTVITSLRDWVTIKSIEMPMVSLVWIGTFILALGTGMACCFRVSETVKAKMISTGYQQLSAYEVRQKAIVNHKATANT